MTERERIRQAHDAEQPRPWTEDPIFRKYRFCNVRREDDRVTRWLKKHWRVPYAGHPNMTGAMLLARMINWPPTLEAIGFPKKWDPVKIVATMDKLKGKTWSSAYIVSTCGEAMDKALYVVRTVGHVMGKVAYTPQPNDTLAAVWTRLRAINGLGAGFIAAQVVADLKYCDPHLIDAEDWSTWAVSGPGSRRGLNRFYGHKVNDSWKEKEWKAGLDRMITLVQPLVEPTVGTISAQDWQSVMCEHDKYLRVKNGEGQPRKGYSPETAFTV